MEDAIGMISIKLSAFSSERVELRVTVCPCSRRCPIPPVSGKNCLYPELRHGQLPVLQCLSGPFDAEVRKANGFFPVYYRAVRQQVDAEPLAGYRCKDFIEIAPEKWFSSGDIEAWGKVQE